MINKEPIDQSGVDQCGLATSLSSSSIGIIRRSNYKPQKIDYESNI
jgi:hypothetical protein